MTYRLQAMNWWTIISQTLTFFNVVMGSNPYTLSAQASRRHQQSGVDIAVHMQVPTMAGKHTCWLTPRVLSP